MKQTIEYYKWSRPEVAIHVPKSTKTILDIGCGQGGFLKLVKEQTGAETWGIEAEAEVADKARQYIDKALAGKIEDVLSSVPDNYFDCITFNDVLEHLPEPSDILKNVKSKLSSEGIIIASIPNVRYFFNLYELIVKKDWEYKDFGILDSTHFRFFTKKSMKRMFESSGYNVLKQAGLNPIRSFKFVIFQILTLNFFSDTKYLQFIVVAKAG